jgi:tryptophan halogenase
MAQPITSVLVVGEGSAGLLAALALKKRFPALDVRILASKRKPIIGVGESTTAAFPYFLHTYLDISPTAFHKAVRPTWKLGLRFERWGTAASNEFEFAFDRQILRREDGIPERLGFYYSALGRDLSLASALIRKKKSPVLRDPSTGECRFHPYGYHIENQRLPHSSILWPEKEGFGFTMATYGRFSPTIPVPLGPYRLIPARVTRQIFLSTALDFRHFFSTDWV